MKIFLLASSFSRFHSELGFHAKSQSLICSECGYPKSDLLGSYFWDFEFSSPTKSLDSESDFFWCEFAILVTERCKEILQAESIPLSYQWAEIDPSEEFPAGIVSPRLMLAQPLNTLRLDTALNSLQECGSCKKIRGAAWKLTGLRLSVDEARRAGVFTIAQNRGSPLFVTEDVKHAIDKLGLKGLKFYPAGVSS